MIVTPDIVKSSTPSRWNLVIYLYVTVCAHGCGLHQLRELTKHPTGELRWHRLPVSFALGQFVLRDLQVDAAVGNIHANDVAIFDQGNRTTHGSLRCNVTDTQTGGTTRKSSVGDQQHIRPQSGTLNSTGDG